MEKQDSAILYGVPKAAYGQDGCTPFPMCIRSCAEYLGLGADYTRAMAESGAAFRLAWNTACWDGGNVDAVLAFDDPTKVFRLGIRAMERGFRFLGRTPETKKEEFMDVIRREIDEGSPVIALSVIGPPEACIVTGYREGGSPRISGIPSKKQCRQGISPSKYKRSLRHISICAVPTLSMIKIRKKLTFHGINDTVEMPENIIF